MNKKIVVLFLLMLIMLVAAVLPVMAEEPLKVAMILSGPINDDDFNSVGYNGLKKACPNCSRPPPSPWLKTAFLYGRSSCATIVTN